MFQILRSRRDLIVGSGFKAGVDFLNFLQPQISKLTESADIPNMNSQLVDDSLPISVVPDSIVFATTKGFKAPACSS